ncbi:lysine-N-methylase [Lachnospiraceae bacterium KM106-2]|nr:lysine-N-methylase [Lachnospiraceae bacterium KM106-2]
MILRVPDYYEQFKCLADRCKDSCCIGWEIDIDEDTYDYYKTVEGEFGDRLRSKIMNSEEPSFILQKGGRCPLLNKDNLCDICIELGESSLCEICTEYPRFTLEYDHTREKCLGLSCEEAGRLIFLDDHKASFLETEIPEYYDEDEDETEEEKGMASYFQDARDMAIQIVQWRERKIEERISLLIAFATELQELIKHDTPEEIEELVHNYGDILLGKQRAIEVNPAIEEELKLAFEERMELFAGMEILDEEWRTYYDEVKAFFETQEYAQSLKDFMSHYREREYEYENLMVYFIFRYFMKAVYDSNVLAKVKFAAASFLMIRDMDIVRFVKNGNAFTVEDRIDVARIYSKEVEHSEDNLEYLSECFLFEEVFQTESMMKQVIGSED